MSQNGQGNEPHLPAVPPAREGVVLPSSGNRPGEPSPSGSWAPEPQATPAAGQPWGQPWGPDSESAAPPQQHNAWGAAPGAPEALPGGGSADAPARQYPPQPGALPPAAPPVPPGPPPGGAPAHGRRPQPYSQPQPQAQPYPQPGQQQPYPQAQPYSQPGQQPYAQQQSSPDDETRMLPPEQPAPGHGSPFDGPGAGPGAGPWPQAGQDSEATRFMPPVTGHGGAPLPPEAPSEQAEERTTFLRRQDYPAGPAAGGGEADATQVMGMHRPAAPGAPEADPTRPMPSAAAGGEPPRPAGAPFGIRPGMPGDRPPPAEFDGLFRSDPAPGADRTRHMPPAGGQPQYGPQGAAPHPFEQQSRADRRNAASRGGLSTAAIIGIVVAACAVVGLAAGAALSSDDASEGEQPEAGAGKGGASQGPDPAVQQAKNLDALLADSNNSRSKVINAVASIKTCTNLDTAAADLRAAATQRRSLVTRLAKTKTGSLPAHAELTRALNEAWKASASADAHYAAWADQVAGKKGCHKGRARATAHTAAGNRASGEATVAKKRAAPLWNAIAEDHGLTKRQYGQL